MRERQRFACQTSDPCNNWRKCRITGQFPRESLSRDTLESAHEHEVFVISVYSSTEVESFAVIPTCRAIFQVKKRNVVFFNLQTIEVII